MYDTVSYTNGPEPLAAGYAQDPAMAAREDRGSDGSGSCLPRRGPRYLAAQFAQAVHGLIPFAQLPRDGLAHVRAQIASTCVCRAATAATRLPTRTAHRRAFSRIAPVTQRHTGDRHHLEADLRSSSGQTCCS
ncbi:MAG TPA: hypothetical protein VMF03_21255 [Steroidobacteraceae bacterium]|nr:hypothetical protein [Steroidobacteraceae bacterium]